MKCSKCEMSLFKIQIIPCCGDCIENDAWDPETEEYTSDVKLIDEKNLARAHVGEQGECNFGSAFGEGCYMFICSECNNKRNLAIANSC